MYLKSIKLAGFKSFADAVTIPIRSRMNAIVGPNGCGKSNIIDAVRWVIGETSAKQLRGQSLADVIFNGTSSRKPIGKAAIELQFDNSDGRIGGEFSKFTDIKIRREIQREGQSNYYINNTSCRRRDILDVFRGTGLGPRSYAIIEQGMISNIIEAKPEDMRLHIEEVAGISTYKVRRRETENRMNRTQENLDRLSDLREELSKQLRHLKRQAEAAEKYRELKVEERELNAQIKALHWQSLNEQLIARQEQIDAQQTRREEVIAKQRHLETDIEKARVKQGELTADQNEVQKRYYSLAAEIARIEQRIKHTQEQQQRWRQELDEADRLWDELQESMAEQRDQISVLTEELAGLQPQSSNIDDQLLTADHHFQVAEEAAKASEKEWEAHLTLEASIARQIEVARTNLQHYKSQIERLNTRMQQLRSGQDQQNIKEMQAELNPLLVELDAIKEAMQCLARDLENATKEINHKREENARLNDEIKQSHQLLRDQQSQCAALEAIQKSALQSDDECAQEWMQQQQLMDHLRLGQAIQVASGWEHAAETVLGHVFDAICVEDFNNYLSSLSDLQSGSICLLAKSSKVISAGNLTTTLASKITSEWPIDHLLADIYVADSFSAANALREKLQSHESIITPDGLWLGKDWLRVSRLQKSEDSVIVREQKIAALHTEIEALEQTIAKQEQALSQGEQALRTLEESRDVTQQTYQQKSQALNEKQTAYTAKQTRLEEAGAQQQRVIEELNECDKQLHDLHANNARTDEELQQNLMRQTEIAQEKEVLLERRHATRRDLEEARKEAQQTQQRADELGIRLSSNESQLALLQQTIARNERQVSQLEQRRKELTLSLTDTDGPQKQFEEELQQQLNQRLEVEKELHSVEEMLRDVTRSLNENEEQRSQFHEQLAQLQSELEKMKMDHQAIAVRQTTIVEQLQEGDLNLDTVIAEMPEEAELKVWEERAERVERRISRLGPINLAAIDEFDKLTERKNYLDKQHADLEEALTVLQNAIRKIDKETKTKFKETFDIVNGHFQRLFPQIFGGGRATLELEEDDLLTAGILVKAQPPGKRNSTIHMLSGGEKALTAISLVFAMFQLNPAPFCILDEVDAPLDDLNVGRFCRLVKEMSKVTQFLVISHNKVTIGEADSLMGVTMQEPGVSRLVSVDMEAAMAMVD